MATTILKILPLLWLMGISLPLLGQSGQVTGQLQGPEGNVLPFATLLIKTAADSSLVKTALTDEDGSFSFNELPAGPYFLQASYLGLSTYFSPLLETGGQPLRLGVIRLEASAASLNTVEVVAEKPLIDVQADKTVFNVQKSLNATGTNGFELLRKAPGIIVDNNDNLLLEGKTGVLIYIDGKPSPLAGADLANYLRSLQASDIEAIELITQPSSRYDAAGAAGIINIRLKKDERLGTNGTLSAGYAYGRNSRYNNSLSFNNRTPKANLFGTYSNDFGDTWSFLYLDRIQEGVRYDSKTETLNDNGSHNARLGFDLFPAEQHTIGVLFNGNLNHSIAKSRTNTPIIPLATGEVEQALIADNQNENDNYNLNGNLNYRYADTTGQELAVDADYGQYQRERASWQPNRYFDGQDGSLQLERNYRIITLTDIEIVTAKADYSRQLLGGQLSAGGKYARISTDNDFSFYDVGKTAEILNDGRSNRFRYSENINAAYVNYQIKRGPWNLQFGLRAEQTISEGDLQSTQPGMASNVRRNYLDWFPSGGLTYSPKPTSSWAIAYSRRIQRPNYQSLNPFENQLDELSFSKGNPFLQPQYTDNIKLSHTYKYSLVTSISYSYVKDFFAQITDTLDNNRSFMITRNIANQRVWSLNISSPVQITDWWSAYLSINAFRSSYEARDERFRAVSQSTLTFYGQNTFSLPLGIKLQVSGWYSSPYVWSGTYQSRSLGSLDAGLQRKFADGRLSVNLSVSDILYTSPWRADMRYGGLYIDGTGGWESRRLRVNVSYAFGSEKVARARKRKAGLEEEEGRVSN